MGTQRITLTILNGICESQQFVYEGQGRCVIGRARECDLKLPARLVPFGVSRHHCMLVIDGPVVRVCDLGSRNGTRVNGKRIITSPTQPWDLQPAPSQELKDGDCLVLGAVLIRVAIDANDDTPLWTEFSEVTAPRALATR